MIMIISLISNSLLLYSLAKTKQIYTNTQRFIIAMSISDLLQAVLVMPSTATTIAIREKHKSCMLDQLTHFGFYLFGYFSYFMLMSITFDRLYILRRHLRVPKALSTKQMASFLTTCFIVTFTGSYLGVKFISFRYQVTLMIINIGLIGFVFISYSCLLHKVRIHNTSVTKNLADSNFKGKVSAKVNVNASNVVWVLLVALLVSYVPFNVTTPWLSYVKYEKKDIPSTGLSIATMWA